MFRKLVLLVLFIVLPINIALAVSKFLIKEIRVEGLQRISAGTVFNYIPVKVGDVMTPELSRLAIRKLFKTGFFRDVRLEREGNILVVQVVERPTITKISIDGSKEISEKDLIETMKGLGLAEGRVFNRSLLEKVERELKQTYYNVGKYSARIKTTVTPLERNRVSLQLDISEGMKSAIVDIHLVGNEKFKDKKLRKGFKQKTKSSFGIFKSRYQYSKQKLVGDIERLRNFYQNRGFMKFNVESTQVSITPDKENVFVTINISEGKKYTISGINIAGKLVLPEADIRKLITIKPGDVFSRKIITRIQKSINDAHGDIGYAFTKISITPKIDDTTATVLFTFNIDPGQRVYVRKINFSGNTITSDLVLRREMRQLEGGWLSRKKLERSRVRLQRLGFFDSVRIKTERVAGTTDQMDITFVVKERQTGNINLALGYSDVDGAIITAGVTQSNLFGTGKNLNVSINRSDSTRSANFGYSNPYYTLNGVSRGFNLFVTEIDAAEANTAAYNSKTIGLGMFYGIPVSENRRLTFGLTIESLEIVTRADTAQVAKDFVTANGEKNSILRANVSWSYDTLNSRIFPSKGTVHRVSLETTIPGSDLEYYSLNYTTLRFWKVSDRTTFRAKLNVSYGDGFGDTEALPFYKNYFAGGSNTVRGYESRSLGPRDTVTPFDPIGGSKRVLTSLEYFFPAPGTAEDNNKLRLSLFIDGGMVYGANESVDLNTLRFTAGLSVSWFTAVGPLRLSFSTPLNEEPGDETESFQFSIGVPFR